MLKVTLNEQENRMYVPAGTLPPGTLVARQNGIVGIITGSPAFNVVDCIGLATGWGTSNLNKESLHPLVRVLPKGTVVTLEVL